MMTGTPAEFSQEVSGDGSPAWRIGVTGVAGDSDKPIFSDGAGCPCRLSFGGKPVMRWIMVYVLWIAECQKHVYIK
jgi:hypothetical protein